MPKNNITIMELYSICKLKLIVIVYYQLLFLQLMMSRDHVFAAGLEILPSWNVVRDDSQPCVIDNSTAEQGFITFHGSPNHMCSFQVTSDQHVGIEVLDGFAENDLLFVDLMIPCEDQYIAWHGKSQFCDIAIVADSFQLDMQSNASVALKEVEAVHPETCGGFYETNSGSESLEPSCSHVQTYASMSMCNIGACRFNFPSNCKAALSKYDILLQCEESGTVNTEHVLLLYPADITELNLTLNNIHSIANQTFSSMQSLKSLFLNNNILEKLPLGVFRVLKNLEVLNLAFNNLTTLPDSLLEGLVNLRDVDLQSNQLVTLDSLFFQGLNSLLYINLNHNELTCLPYLYQLPGLLKISGISISSNPLYNLLNGTFQGLSTLATLIIERAMLSNLHVGVFDGLKNLRKLYLGNNFLVSLDADVFRGLYNLQELRLNDNKLKTLPAKIFHKLKNLEELSLSRNELTSLVPEQFEGLPKLSYLTIYSNNLVTLPILFQAKSLGFTLIGIWNNPLIDISQKSMSGLGNRTVLFVNQHEICDCFIPKDVKCIAENKLSPYRTCDRLLSDTSLVVVMWLIGLLSLLGNLFVIVWKQMDSDGNKVQSVLLTNLAISDFIMGVYMIIIAIADIYFGDQFPLRSEKWRNSVTCRIAGTLSILSSEASVFFVTLISIDRVLHVVFPFSPRKFKKSSIYAISILTWMFAFALALVPNILSGQNFKFYDNSHVCIGFPLARSIQEREVSLVTLRRFKRNGPGTGLYYSTTLFLGLNGLLYLIILSCYIAIIRAVRASSKRSGRSHTMNTQINLTIKVTAIVATDFLCWFPIIVLGILVQTRAITLSSSVFAWLVTCVLPINSAVNPYLYTIFDFIKKQCNKSDMENSNRTKNTIDLATVS